MTELEIEDELSQSSLSSEAFLILFKKPIIFPVNIKSQSSLSSEAFLMLHSNDKGGFTANMLVSILS